MEFIGDENILIFYTSDSTHCVCMKKYNDNNIIKLET